MNGGQFLKCDVPGCDHVESVETLTEDMVGKPCLLCGANLLTRADYEGALPYLATIKAIKAVLPEPVEGDKVDCVSVNFHEGKLTMTAEVTSLPLDWCDGTCMPAVWADEIVPFPLLAHPNDYIARDADGGWCLRFPEGHAEHTSDFYFKITDPGEVVTFTGLRTLGEWELTVPEGSAREGDWLPDSVPSAETYRLDHDNDCLFDTAIEAFDGCASGETHTLDAYDWPVRQYRFVVDETGPRFVSEFAYG